MTEKVWHDSWHPGFGAYVAAHPTRYSFRSDVADVSRAILRQLGGPTVVSLNTYVDHPPGWGRDLTSVDWWGEWGRGDPLGTELRRRVFRAIFNREGAPYIAWIISGGGMWTSAGGWQDAPWGAAGSDAGHYNHVHVTYR